MNEVIRIHTMDWKDPEIIGPPNGEECDRCHVEPAEHRVRDYGQVPEDEPVDFDFCGTCYLEWLNDARRTPDESMEYWTNRKDRRFEEEP